MLDKGDLRHILFSFSYETHEHKTIEMREKDELTDIDHTLLMILGIKRGVICGDEQVTYLLSLKRRSFGIEEEEEACWSWDSAEWTGGMDGW